MIIQEPFTLIVNKNKPFAFFKIENNKYLLFNGLQIIEMGNNYNENEYIVIMEKDILPFIIIHNIRINNIINILKNNSNTGKYYLLNIAKNAYIENVINTNLSINDIYSEYDNDIITYDELYLWLIIDAQRRYK